MLIESKSARRAGNAGADPEQQFFDVQSDSSTLPARQPRAEQGWNREHYHGNRRVPRGALENIREVAAEIADLGRPAPTFLSADEVIRRLAFPAIDPVDADREGGQR